MKLTQRLESTSSINKEVLSQICKIIVCIEGDAKVSNEKSQGFTWLKGIKYTQDTIRLKRQIKYKKITKRNLFNEIFEEDWNIFKDLFQTYPNG
ncbi:hypothetical protein BpHYR1_051031 [Brachionus plicatilis]|uniref:Uncharacterized protein n=1 Tax=Brachionus plicatilis TaxID=10195 RepID=A0A3M7SQJ3_BRAPC|nr:hypothetical protein BpHYR1_051031 [Brachionus plicatilis]